MTQASAYKVRKAVQTVRSEGVTLWTEPWVRQVVKKLAQEALTPSGNGHGLGTAVSGIVQLAMQPDVLAALRGRSDPEEAVRDVATRYAFAALIAEGRSFHQLDSLSQAMIQRTLDVIYKRAFQVAEYTGEDPLDADPRLLLSLCKNLSCYRPGKPMGAHISWKLRHYEGAVSRAMRQIQHLVRCREVTEAFVAHVLEVSMEDELKAGLLQLARGGGRSGLDCKAVIRFFARPETVAFVRRFADTVQTARTLYCEEEYQGLDWKGKRRLPNQRRQGYLEAALASLERLNEDSLDREGLDLHSLLVDESAPATGTGIHDESFEIWVVHQALEERPEDPLWQAAALLYIQKLPSQELLAEGLATAEALDLARQRMEELRANPDVWQAWMEATLA